MSGATTGELQPAHQILMGRAVPQLFDRPLVDVTQTKVADHVVAAEQHIAPVIHDHPAEWLGTRTLDVLPGK